MIYQNLHLKASDNVSTGNMVSVTEAVRIESCQSGCQPAGIATEGQKEGMDGGISGKCRAV